MNLFGFSVDTDDVEQAVIGTLQFWIDSYLADKERQKGWPVGQLGRPASYNATFDYQNWPEAQLPGIAVVCPGTVDDAEYHQQISAWFEVNVDVLVTGQVEQEVKQVAAGYQSAIAQLLVQQADLAGAQGDQPFASEVVFVRYDVVLPDVDNRTLAVGTTQFRVLVPSILDPTTRPLTPPGETDPGDGPPAEQTNLTLLVDQVGEPIT